MVLRTPSPPEIEREWQRRPPLRRLRRAAPAVSVAFGPLAASLTLDAGLAEGRVPVPAWVIVALGAFIVVAVVVFLAVQRTTGRNDPR